MKALVLLVAAALGWFDLSGSRKPEEPRKLEEIQVEVTAAWEWLPLGSQNALRLRRAVDAAGKPYDPSLPGKCSPSQLERALRFERNELISGEPLVAEMRVEARGTCLWHEPVGGNYRGRGRDDNFLFLARGPDGQWLSDPYGTQGIYIGGGLSSTVEVSSGKPFSHWLGVPRWLAFDKSGRHEVYAFQFAHEHEVIGIRQALIAAIPPRLAATAELEPDSYYLRDRKTKARVAQMIPTIRDRARPSPIAATLPPEVRAKLGELADGVADYGSAVIQVRDGTAAERAAMIATWTKLAESRSERWPSSKGDAAHEAIWFSRGDDFLDTLARWMKGTRQQPLDGLAMNPSPRAAALLLASPSEHAAYALHRLAPQHIPRAIPIVSQWLEHPDRAVRTASEQQLRRWRGKR